MATRALVTGAGGFIGHHLARFLSAKGYEVRGVDLKEPGFEKNAADEFRVADLRNAEECEAATEGIDEVYNLAADMGGIGYITAAHAEIARNNTLINTHMLEASRNAGVSRYFFASSACVYPDYRQDESDVTALREDDAYPAQPEEGYGWEKLYTEKLCQYYREDHGLETRIARFHNVYGPLGTYEGGREKAPAAICRKVALAADGDDIEVWGDGKQTRSFMYIDDCLEGIWKIAHGDYVEPLNLGMDELVTVDQLVDVAVEASGKRLTKRYDASRPQGVRGRNSDNTLIRRALGWAPSIPLATGMLETYRWIEGELRSAGKIPERVDAR